MNLIEVNSVTKFFDKSERKSALKELFKTILRILNLSNKQELKLNSNHFVALKNISFEIKKGEAVALIGSNGAGKSTMLKIINGLYGPTKGSVKVHGKIQALIELGAGFHYELSGRENLIFSVSMIPDLNKEEKEQLMQEIIDFSELNEFIDFPVKKYSSGMKARLGFSAAIFANPDILLVDEVLSVGDFKFRQKCLRKINEIREKAAVILVSHNLQTIKLFCSRAILFEKGSILFDGDVQQAINLYRQADSSDKEKPIAKAHLGEDFVSNELISNLEVFWCDKTKKPKKTFKRGEPIYLSFKITFKIEVGEGLLFSMPFWKDDINISSISSEYNECNLSLKSLSKGVLLKVDNTFNSGAIDSCFILTLKSEYLIRKILNPFEVTEYDARIHGVSLCSFEEVKFVGNH